MNQNKTVNHRGFSLIELLIVIACIGIIMAISYPHMRNALIDACCNCGSAAFIALRISVRPRGVSNACDMT